MSYPGKIGIVSGGNSKSLSLMALQYNRPTNLFNVYTPGSGVQSGGRASNPGIRRALARRAQLYRGTMETPHTGRCKVDCPKINNPDDTSLIYYNNGNSININLLSIFKDGKVDIFNKIFNNSSKIIIQKTPKLTTIYNSNPFTASSQQNTLKQIVLNRNITNIESNTFACYLALETISGISFISEIKSGVFNNCIKLQNFEIVLPMLNYISSGAFVSCLALDNFTISPYLTIQENAFINCLLLNTLLFNSLEGINISKNAFINQSIKKVYFYLKNNTEDDFTIKFPTYYEWFSNHSNITFNFIMN